MKVSDIYNSAFQDHSYSAESPERIEFVNAWAKRNNLKALLDVGCGRGYYMKKLPYQITGLEPSTYLCENDLKGLNVVNLEILEFNTSKRWDGLYCMDVLEHIPPEDIDATLRRLATLANKGYLGIANHRDAFNGVELHLINENASWWKELLDKYFKDVVCTFDAGNYFIFEVVCTA